MSEMSKQEAIDIIKAERECVHRQGRTGECCRDDMGCGACDLVMEDVDIIEAYDMAIDALQENEGLARSVNEASELLQKRVRRWIPCSERLPDKNGDYLATYKSVFCDDVVVDNVRFTTEMGFYYDNVVAWMPLPKPYKRGEAE